MQIARSAASYLAITAATAASTNTTCTSSRLGYTYSGRATKLFEAQLVVAIILLLLMAPVARLAYAFYLRKNRPREMAIST